MKKFIILVVCIVLLTGCNSEYVCEKDNSVTNIIWNGKYLVQETVSIKTKNKQELKETEKEYKKYCDYCEKDNRCKSCKVSVKNYIVTSIYKYFPNKTDVKNIDDAIKMMEQDGFSCKKK